jgi:hypothetical protein
MAVQLQLRRGTASQWTAANTLLAEGEIGLETDTNKIKIGDGSTVWTSLAYYSAGSGAVTSVAGRTGAVTLSTSDISGLGTIATQAANNVTITGGSVTGITDLAVADGGTGASTASGARTNLGLVIGTDVLAPNGSAASLTSFPTFNQNTTGTAANVTGTVAIANGGTGATTRQDAMDALAGAVTSGQYLRGNGTDVVMSSIQAADVPTLNQNTTGTASNVTGTVAIANGGTGQTTASAGFNALSPVTSTGDIIVGNGTNSSTRLGIGTNGYVLTSNGTTATWAAASGGSALTVKDEGTTLSSAVTSFDFVGAGVVATNTGGAITVTVAGGGGGGSSPIPKLQSWSIGAM